MIQDLGFVGAAVFLAARVAPVRPGQFGLVAPASPWRAVGLLIAGALAFIVISVRLLLAASLERQEKELVKEIGGNSGTLGVLAVCALTTVVAPVCEELLFRGFIFRGAAQLARAVAGGADHRDPVRRRARALRAARRPGFRSPCSAFVLCVIYWRSGSLYPCIALHRRQQRDRPLERRGLGAGRTVALLFGSVALVALLLACVRLASERWMPASA